MGLSGCEESLIVCLVIQVKLHECGDQAATGQLSCLCIVSHGNKQMITYQLRILVNAMWYLTDCDLTERASVVRCTVHLNVETFTAGITFAGKCGDENQVWVGEQMGIVMNHETRPKL